MAEKAPSQPINTITLLFAGFTREQIIDAQEDDPSEAQLALNLGINTNPLDPESWNEYTSLHSQYFQEAQQNKIVNGQNQIELKAVHESFNVPPNPPYHTSYQDHLEFINLVNDPGLAPFDFGPPIPFQNDPEEANKEQAGGKSRKSLFKKSLFKKKRTKSLLKKKRTKRRRGYGGGSPKRGGKSTKKKVERIVEFKRGPGKKKYTAIVRRNKTGKKRTIHFGHKDYQQFKDSTPLGYYSYKNHGTKKRKDAYYSRHSGTKKKGAAIKKEFNKSRGKYTPKLLSHIYLW